MRRVTWVIAIIVCVSVFLVGCGKKSANEVVKDLDHMMGKLTSYQGIGTMKLNSGQLPQEYQVEVWYQNPHFYRISLTNEKKDITQIVLRNDEGVFVLTPHLNKSFRFQSDWPDNQGQVYLFQTLARSIIGDKQRQFIVDDKKGAYVFDVVANYQNSSLARQKIWLNKGNYAPQHVEISDASSNIIVSVDFSEFEFGKSFDKDSFDMKRNMTSFNLQSLPTMTADAAGTDSSTDTPNDASTGTVSDTSSVTPKDTSTGTINDAQSPPTVGKTSDQAKAKQEDFGVIEPVYLPTGVNLKDITDIKLGENPAILLRFSGDYSYTIIESRPADLTVSLLPGTLVDLGYTFAILTGEVKKTLSWMNDGVEFRLSSDNLPQNEMIQIAQSVEGQVGK